MKATRSSVLPVAVGSSRKRKRSRKIQIGVAGLGRIGWNFHARNLAQHADFTLAAVTDPVPGRRLEAERELGCKSHARFEDMLDCGGLDAVVIATPTHLHRDMAIKAFERGLHVLLEKPMAVNCHDAEAIARKAKSAGRILTVYQPHRLAAYFQHLRRLIDSGIIGDVHWVERGSFAHCRRNDWQSLQKYGGGMLNNYGAHFLDQVLNLVGYDIKRLFCDLQIVASLGDADDAVKIIIETRAGVIGEVNINQASCIKPYEFMVWGQHGGIMYRNNEFELRYFDPAKLPAKKLDRRLAGEGRKYPSDNIAHIEKRIPVDASLGIDVFANFATAIRTGVDPAVPPRETLALMRTLTRCRASSGGIRRFN